MSIRCLLVVVIGVLASACGASSSTTAPASTTTTGVVTVAGAVDAQLFPDVVGAVAALGEQGWDFDVTVSSPYDTPERYADAWRVVGPDGAVFGVRELTHDHASEQPFTRSLRGVEIPPEVDVVVVEGRDSANGWGGERVEVALDRG